MYMIRMALTRLESESITLTPEHDGISVGELIATIAAVIQYSLILRFIFDRRLLCVYIQYEL